MSRSTIPRPAATTVILRDHGKGLQVLMLRRSLTASFMPGAYVFPGGAVEPGDGTAAVTALRECFEECGLWLGLDRAHAARGLADARRRLIAGAVALGALAAELGWPLATEVLLPWSHWVTPIDLPKRFDTRFFVAPAPADQQPTVDRDETIALVWVNSAEALARHAGGGLPLEFATLRTLESLLPFTASAAVFEHARGLGDLLPIHPRVALNEAGEQRVLMPGDAGHDELMRLDPEGTALQRTPFPKGQP